MSVEEELQLAKKLKEEFCYLNGKEKEITKSAKLLYQLGLIYQSRSPDKISLIQSAALLNAAIARKPDNVAEVEKDLQKLCKEILHQASAEKTEFNLVDKANDVKERLTKMRSSVENSLSELKTFPNTIEADQLYELEENKISAIQNIQDKLTSDYTSIMKDITCYCEQVMGKRPCEYSHVGMGSLARKEITPYSDFENIIVLEEGCQRSDNYQATLDYFRWFSVIYQVILINLQETILPSVSINSLNDTSKKDEDWFFDAFTTRGVSFDGMMPHACKSPLGRQQITKEKPWKTELIKPVSEMLNYLKTDESLKNGYHLSDILTSTTFVYGKKEIYNEFLKGVQKTLNSVPNEVLKDEITEQLKDDLNSFAIKPSLSALSNQDEFNHKRIVYRSITLFISALGRLNKISANSCLDIICELYKQGIITKYSMHKLSCAVAVALETRLKFYMNNKGQVDLVCMVDSTKSSNSIEFNLIDAVGEQSCINFFQVAYSLQCDICKQLEMKKMLFYRSLTLLNVLICNFLHLDDTAKRLMEIFMENPTAETQLLDFETSLCYLEQEVKGLQQRVKTTKNEHQNSSNLNLSAHFFQVSEILYHMESYNEAIEYGQRYLKSVGHSISNNDDQKTSNIVERAIYVVAHCHYRMQHYDKALKHFQDLLTIQKRNGESETTTDESVAETLEMIGRCLLNTNEYEKAMSELLKSLKIKQLASSDEGAAILLHEVGRCLLNTKQYKQALDYLLESLKIKRQVSSDETNDKSVATTLSTIGSCFLDTNQYEDAINTLQTALKIKQKVPLSENDDEGVANTLHEIGRCLLLTYKYKEALSYFVKSLKIKQQVSLDDLSVAITLHKIGSCLLRTSQYEEAMKYFRKALQIKKKCSSDESTDKNVASTLQAIGNCLLHTSQYKDAMNYFEISLEIRQKASSDVSTDKSVASSFHAIGRYLMDVRQYKDAMISFEKSLKIKQKVSSDEDIDKSVAVTLHEIGRCLLYCHQHDEAMIHLQKSLSIKKKVSSNEDFDKSVANTLHTIGHCLLKLNQCQEAKRILQKSLKIKQRLSSNVNMDSSVASTLCMIGNCLLNAKQYAKAMRYLQKALAIRQRVSINEGADKNVATNLSFIGRCLALTNQYEDAMSSLLQSLEIFRQVSLNKDADISIATAMHEIGRCLLKTKQHEEAKSYLEKSLDIKQRVSSDAMADKSVAFTLSTIGSCLLDTNQYEEALSYLQKSLEVQLQLSLPENADKDVATTLHEIGRYFFNTKQYEEAMRHFQDSLKLQKQVTLDENRDIDVATTLHEIGCCLSKTNQDHEAEPYFEKSQLIMERVFSNDLSRMVEHNR